MATGPIPAPVAPTDASASNPGPGGGFPSPAPAQTDPRAAEMLRILLGVVTSMKMIAQTVPAATSEVRQINDLVAQILAKVKAGGPAAETQAPPV